MGITEDRRHRDDSWDAGNILRLRRHAGLSQRALAQELNARQQTISEWERGAYAPRGTAARLLTRVAEDVQFPFEHDAPDAHDSDDADDAHDAQGVEGVEGAAGEHDGEADGRPAGQDDDRLGGGHD